MDLDKINIMRSEIWISSTELYRGMIAIVQHLSILNLDADKPVSAESILLDGRRGLGGGYGNGGTSR